MDPLEPVERVVRLGEDGGAARRVADGEARDEVERLGPGPAREPEKLLRAAHVDVAEARIGRDPVDGGGAVIDGVDLPRERGETVGSEPQAPLAQVPLDHRHAIGEGRSPDPV